MGCLCLAVTTQFCLSRGSKRSLVGIDRSAIWRWSEPHLTVTLYQWDCTMLIYVSILLNSCGRCDCTPAGPSISACSFSPHRPLQDPSAPPGPTGPFRFRRLYESIQSLVAFTTFLGSMLGGQKVTNCCWKKERKENCILCSSEQVLSKKIIG